MVASNLISNYKSEKIVFHSSLLYYAECSIQINYPFLLILLSPLYSFRQPNICRFVACSNFSILLSLALNFLPHFCCCNSFALSLFVVSNQFGKWCATFEFDAWDWNAIVLKKHDKIRMYISLVIVACSFNFKHNLNTISLLNDWALCT